MTAKTKKTIWIALLAAALILLILTAAYFLWEKPPEIAETPAEPQPEEGEPAEIIVEAVPSPTPEPMPEGEAFETDRLDGVYTILLVGLDQMSTSTDTIIVGKIDTKRHEMNFLSIPRDTIINVEWDVRKINAVYSGSVLYGGTGVDSLSNHIRRIMGYVPDCYAVIDLNTFIEVIDLLGGVDFDVPSEVDYYFDDIEKGLHIHLDPGFQHLDGYGAMAVVRNREGYIWGDLDRIDVQHDFLKACADKMLSLGTVPNARKIVDLLDGNLQTNLSAANIAWFMRQMLLCRSQKIRFFTLPAENHNIHGYSYAVPKIWEWIEMLNTYFNPFEQELGYGSLNIVYWDGKEYKATVGLDGAWYYDD